MAHRCKVFVLILFLYFFPKAHLVFGIHGKRPRENTDIVLLIVQHAKATAKSPQPKSIPDTHHNAPYCGWLSLSWSIRLDLGSHETR